MQSLSLKFGDRRDDWKCFLCCHVRTGTIFLGVWHLMLHVLTLSVLAVLLRHPEFIISDDSAVMVPPPPALPTPLSEVDVEFKSSDLKLSLGQIPDANVRQQHHFHSMFEYRHHRPITYQDLNLAFIAAFCTFSITLLMVFGAIRGKPSYLMPFFCLQVFDFCLAFLTAINFVCYIPDAHQLVQQLPRFPFQADILGMSSQTLSLIILSTFMLALLTKAYFIGVVWSCYKYLSLRILAAQRTIHYIDPDIQTLLPDYESAIKKFAVPPPSYATATSGPATAVVGVPPPYSGPVGVATSVNVASPDGASAAAPSV